MSWDGKERRGLKTYPPATLHRERRGDSPYAHIYATQAGDVPEREHWAILRSGSTYVPGDERSRTNPGHGYPGGVERHIEYLVYFSQDLFLKHLGEALSKREPVRGIHVTGETFELSTSIRTWKPL